MLYEAIASALDLLLKIMKGVPIMTAPRTAAAYIRVSTEEQADQSPESQLVEIRKYAAAHGLILPDDLVYMDEGISGKRSENRPAFQRMIGAAKAKPAPFDVILLWKFSRFARNQEESIVYKALLRKQCGVDVVSVSEQLPDGPFASLIERIIEWFDEFYSIRLAQEVKRSMTVKAGKGEFQSAPSFGYRARMEPGKKTVLEPIPEEAAIVREIFERFVSGQGCYAIAKWLNAQGITTHRGNAWENRTVEYMIRNPVYIGKLRWTPSGRTRRDFTNPDTITADAEHEPIISQNVFDAAQTRMTKIKSTRGYKARPTYGLKDWLSGLVRCSECGATLVFQRPHYFKCNNYLKGRCTCSQHVRADLLHEAVLSTLEHALQDAKPIDYKPTFTRAEQSGELPRLRASLAGLRRRTSRLLDAYLSGALGLEQFTTANASLDAAVKEAELQIADIEAKAAKPDDIAAALSASITSALDTLQAPDMSLEGKNNALRRITERIVFNKSQNTLDIEYRIIF